MSFRPNSSHKKERARSQFFREFVVLFRKLALDEPILNSIFPTKTETAPDGSVMYFYFAGDGDQAAVEEVLKTLILYKPSIRKAIGDQIRKRYVPQIIFRYDSTFEKIQRIESLLNNIVSENSSGSDDNDLK
ncbi:ribosome-binding factor A [Candidatus Dependentiae bacterium]|nr:ribosome-binding factor A [Candidatus Dependentiae bacterium]